MRANRYEATSGTEPTMRWMVDDVADRCREVLDELAQSPQRFQLGAAAMALRSAADDLVSVMELIEGLATTSVSTSEAATPFEVAFGITER